MQRDTESENIKRATKTGSTKIDNLKQSQKKGTKNEKSTEIDNIEEKIIYLFNLI